MSFSEVSIKDIKALYKACARIAQGRRPHATGKSLLRQAAAKDTDSPVLGAKVAKQLELIPICYATTSQIPDMASNDKLHLNEKSYS